MVSTEKKSLESFIFIKAELNAIDKSKYIESQNQCRDLYYDNHGKPSQDFYHWWINNHAESFRKAWVNSLCRSCSKIFHCKDCLKDMCNNFDEQKGGES